MHVPPDASRHACPVYAAVRAVDEAAACDAVEPVTHGQQKVRLLVAKRADQAVLDVLVGDQMLAVQVPVELGGLQLHGTDEYWRAVAVVADVLYFNLGFMDSSV